MPAILRIADFLPRRVLRSVHSVAERSSQRPHVLLVLSFSSSVWPGREQREAVRCAGSAQQALLSAAGAARAHELNKMS